MPDSADTKRFAPALERTWVRFLLLLSILVAVGLGGVIALPGSSAPLRFDPPPVDLEFNTQGANSQGPNSKSPNVQQGTPAQSTQGQTTGKPAPTRQRQITPPAGGGGTTAPAQSAAVVAADDNGGETSTTTDAATTQGTKSIRLFGTVEFRSALKNLPKWDRVLSSEKKQPTFGPDKSRMPANAAERWDKLAADIADKPLLEQAQKVNNFFNQWPYKTDMAVWGVEDYWATPAEFMKKSGDCEDYAISKYYALRSLGVPASKLRVAVIIDSIRNLGHAILIVYTDDGKAYVLDNLTNLVLSHERLTHYVPQYSVNEEFLWRHIRPVAKKMK